MRRAAHDGQVGDLLDQHLRRTRRRVPIIAEVFALRAHTRDQVSVAHLAVVRDFFQAIVDLQLPAEELDAELGRAFRRARPGEDTVLSALKQVAAALVDPVDRYWVVVYVLAAELPGMVISWRSIPFVSALQAAFGITTPDMELAALDALCFAPAMPRPQ